MHYVKQLFSLPGSRESRLGVLSRSGLQLRLLAALAGVDMGGGVEGFFWAEVSVLTVAVQLGVRAGSGSALMASSLLPFCIWLSLSRWSFAPFFAFLKRTDVRRPTPPVAGRIGDSVEERPLISLFSGGRSSGLVLLFTGAASESASWLSLLSLRRLGGHGDVLGSDVMGRRVGGSWWVSAGGGDKARPVGSSMGGGVDLQSSRWRTTRCYNKSGIRLALLNKKPKI